MMNCNLDLVVFGIWLLPLAASSRELSMKTACVEEDPTMGDG
jgi:hypothetical protein